MIVFNFLFACSLVIEYFAIIHVEQSISTFFYFHTTASIIFILAISHIKTYYHFFRYYILLLFLFLVYFFPFIGILGAAFLARMLYLMQKRYQRVSIQQLKIEEKIIPHHAKYGIGGLHQVIKKNDTPVATRIKAFKDLSDIAPEKVNHLVRSMLPDKQEELRLLAFYLLNKQEKNRINEINRSLKLLQKATSTKLYAKLHKWLAIQYWELIYKRLVDPNLIQHIIKEAVFHADAALEILPNDPSIIFILGRIYQHQHQLDKALDYFQRSIQLGGLIDRISPYIAEIYFKKREFYEIRKYTQPPSTIFITQINRHLSEFWGTHA